MITGRLRDKIAVFAENETVNNYAEHQKSYSIAFSDRAEISFQSGSEQMFGQMSGATRTMKFRVRFRLNTYNERQLILWRGDYYNIRSIDPDRQRHWLHISADRMPTGSQNIVVLT